MPQVPAATKRTTSPAAAAAAAACGDQTNNLNVISSFEDTFEMFCRGVTTFGPFWDQVLSYWRGSLEDPNHVLFMKFEEMKAEPREQIKRHSYGDGIALNSKEVNTGKVASPGDGEEQGGDNQGWITPPRISRSPSKRSEGPKYGEASILSNTYSALSMVDEVRVEAKDEEEVGEEVELPTTQAPQGKVQKSDHVVSSRGANLPLRQSLFQEALK
ncbi:Sulfotransferase domain [Arabidopsis thaliana x Arabidopsis arenosa]|uniref:Sulfotransferase n=1 Tax=Arabidopsis thaliana x Arabidopsis arenosa TaxID=1240361 RepID=A0A8T1ZLZ1_9BRAS|nr:Sulfotransferase domain [Arabidopsis thaliana x Arabidopsis arenosa]